MDEIKELNLLEADEILKSLGVPYVLACGTALGWYREKGFIEHDPDLDIAVRIEDFNPDITTRLESAGFEIYKIYGTHESGLQYSFFRRGIKFDIFFLYPGPNYDWHSVHRDDVMKKYIYPHLEPTVVEFLGRNISVPQLGWIEAQYGKEEWKVPVKEWNYYESPKNIE